MVRGACFTHLAHSRRGPPFVPEPPPYRVPSLSLMAAFDRSFDALAPFGVRVTEQPLTPERILDLSVGGRP